ncbi:MAG: HlyD family secretion protein [Syntrophaceae bacterium]
MNKAFQMVNNNKKKFTALILFVVLIIAGIVGFHYYREYRKTYVTTDDAYVTGRIHIIASKVSGTVKTVYVEDNQLVKKNDLLAEVDDRDYAVRVKEAESARDAEQSKLAELSTKIVVAKRQLAEMQVSIETAKANLKLQEANLKQAEIDLRRAEKLLKKEVVPEERLERAQTNYDVTSAQVVAAREQMKQIVAAQETQKAVIKQTESALKSQDSIVKQKEETRKAEDLRWSYTKIYAPADGYITKKNVENGNQIQAGQPLMAVVSLADIWIVANYKETQIEHVKSGQKVKIEVDTYPDRKFEGTVDSIMAGTGSVFSLFPPENATGNYVKVVQRVPVKIILNKGTDPDHILRVGMSVVPTIITRE